MNAGAVLNVFFSIIIGAFSLGNATPHISAIGTACGAAYHLFETIDRKSPIDALDESGKTPEKLSGHIVAKGVAFAYPTRPDVPILEDFNLEIPAGKTVALVGMSGSGKSTIVKLVERFYDPTKGTVTIDGIDVKDLNVRWLRSQVGIVSQEPILFNCSIRQNILYGLENGGEGIEPSRLDSMIEEALKTSNAWDFIQKLPNKLDTFVGEAGSMMSGGQKQRIAIARAIIKNPKILLLDEATSALDTESERIVQSALDKASANRTTIAIAHRLSTVKHADKIVVMDRGKIVEMGNHKELVEMKGVYASLVENQELQMFDAVEKIEEPVIKAVEPTPERVIVQVGGDAKSEKAKSIKEEAKKDEPKPDTSRYMKLSRPEWPLFFIGGFAAAVNGVVMPLFSIVFSSLLTALGTNEANNWALYFVFLSIAAFISNFCQVGLFGYAGVKLTRRLRELVFRTILKQEMGFFDRPEHATGILTAKLAEDASQIQALTGVAYGSLAQALAGVIAGLVIAFTACWQLALVILALIPLIGLAGYMQLKTLTGFGAKSKIAYEDASQIATESVANIRTVATLGQEKTFYNNFVKKCQSPHKITIRGAQLSAIGFSFSQAVPFLSWALAFWYGSLLLKWGLYTSKPILNTMFAIIFTAMAAGQSNSHAPDAAKAKVAAVSIAELLDRVSEIDPTTEKGEKRDTIEGKAAVSNVTFAYPTRPENKIVTDISIEAKPGQVVALVGASGCGKSTMIALLERWYDVVDGAASVDDMDVRKWELQNLRSHLALVGQEPVLFNMTIRENIAYGYPSEVDDARIYDVAKMANIHDFVMTLPQGYDTLVGEKGGQLSGGQKQRIAIARALIRNPKLLLLDEATSALDSESEKVVQAALDAASKGRTTIVIAHRLSTIKDADLICVLSKGNVIERGTHQSLVEARGEYFKLVQQQSLA
ncbi:P-loop containing nucleoside triphosphate hydrolase protein [Gorgonomyces haynaldii]|nr:P-loop containing nucleoside triphosphate hydrolase protein [Gorgonomyces haynaldii]